LETFRALAMSLMVRFGFFIFSKFLRTKNIEISQ
jgi:hypothetical protein